VAESFVQYRDRVLSYLGARDPMRVLSATPRRLRRLTAEVPARVLRAHPAPGKWSAGEILAHMADAELALAWRFRNMIATPGVPLPWWDEHLWSTTLAYREIPVAFSLRLFETLRSSNLKLLRRVDRAQLDASYGVHDTRGRQSVADFVRMEAAHDLNHMHQIRRLVQDAPSRRVPRVF
jgi:hypothetical protein